MIFVQIPIGGDRNFAYLMGDKESRLAAVVDPGYSPELIFREAQQRDLTIIYVINTHSHRDHTGANQAFLDRGAKRVGYGIKDGIDVATCPEIHLGDLSITFIHTPGHTPDSICVRAEDKLITGDTLFVGKIGGTRTEVEAQQEYNSLHTQILTLPDHIEIYPGHDVGTAPVSTVANERATNPFLLQKSFEDFLYLKNHWLEYKQRHGIA